MHDRAGGRHAHLAMLVRAREGECSTRRQCVRWERHLRLTAFQGTISSSCSRSACNALPLVLAKVERDATSSWNPG